MSNASRCRSMAASYAKLAAHATDPDAKRAFRRLEFLLRDMEQLAENFDRFSDPRAKEKIYEMIDAVGEYRRRVA
jgi:Ser/Thr protein kinase RdoA (MazF antagonist)